MKWNQLKFAYIIFWITIVELIFIYIRMGKEYLKMSIEQILKSWYSIKKTL